MFCIVVCIAAPPLPDDEESICLDLMLSSDAHYSQGVSACVADISVCTFLPFTALLNGISGKVQSLFLFLCV